MNKLTAIAVAHWVFLAASLGFLGWSAVYAQREHAEYRRHVAGWEKMLPPPQYVPGQCKGYHPQLTIVHCPMYLDEMP